MHYSFIGMEKDYEIKGSGNSYDYVNRFYDNRLGRWLSVDGLFNIYPSISPYNFGTNNPILYMDSDGEGPVIKIYSPCITKKIEKAYAKGNYKEVARLALYAMGNIFDDDYAKRMHAKANLPFLKNNSAGEYTNWKDDNIIYIEGVTDDGNGNYKEGTVYKIVVPKNIANMSNKEIKDFWDAAAKEISEMGDAGQASEKTDAKPSSDPISIILGKFLRLPTGPPLVEEKPEPVKGSTTIWPADENNLLEYKQEYTDILGNDTFVKEVKIESGYKGGQHYYKESSIHINKKTGETLRVETPTKNIYYEDNKPIKSDK